MNASGTCARLLSPASLALDGFATEPVSLMSIRIIKHVLPDGRPQSAAHSWQTDVKADVIEEPLAEGSTPLRGRALVARAGTRPIFDGARRRKSTKDRRDPILPPGASVHPRR
jgi:hypothetical protein